MSWPLSHDFNEAIQNPQIAFADPDLKGGAAVVGATGLPLPRSGNFADVYQVRGADGREWAVKCFTRPVVGLSDRYAQVTAALAKANLPFAVGFTFLAEGIRVGGAWRPVVKMEWVEGLLLNQVARENAGRPAVLAALGQVWVKLCKRLREAGITHADIQHGNVLLVPGSRAGAYGLKLIDYDGMYVPALANTPSGEAGHPSFQHPARAATRAYSPDVDRFPHLVVATALKGLSVGGAGLWERYDNGDNLLFTEDDYRQPSASAAMRGLWRTEHPAVQALVGRLAIACGKPIPQTPWLDQLAPDGEPAPLDDATRREVAAALGIALPVPVALPPEPSFRAMPLPAAPAPVAPPPDPFAFTDEPNEDEADVELVEAPHPAKKRKPKKPPAAAKSRTLLLAGGGLVLLLGCVVAGVLMAGGKSKPPETAERQPDDLKPPVVASPPPPPPTETPKPSPKPKDKVPDPVPTPKDTTPNPASVPVRPGGKFDVRQLWLTKLENSSVLPAPLCGRDSKSVVIPYVGTGDVASLDLDNGRYLLSPPAGPGVLPLSIPLDGGRFACGNITGKTFEVWDPRAGKVVRELSTAGMVLPGPAFVSPTGKYLASGNDGAFKLKSTEPDKLILDLTWEGASVHFTDDESRVLVAEATGRCRWFKLPSGEADGEWTIENVGPKLTPGFGIQAMSGDGSVLAFWGTVSNAPLGVHILDGATGRPRRTFPARLPGHRDAGLSRDGRLLLMHRRDAADRAEIAVVIDLADGATVAEIPPPAGYTSSRAALLPDGSGCVAAVAFLNNRAVVRYAFVPGRPGVAAKPPEPKSPAPAGAGPLKERWSIDVEAKLTSAAPHFDNDGEVVVLVGGGTPWSIATFNARTGKTMHEFPNQKYNFYAYFPMSKGKFAYQATAGSDVTVLDAATGRGTRVAFPLPDGLRGRTPSVGISPNMRYLAVGHHREGPTRDLHPATELRVLESGTNRVLVKTNWHVGMTAFTADSSRILVVDGTDRFRWFKLPSGELDGEWTFDRPANGYNARVLAVSGDGGTILYSGKPPDREESVYLLDGKTGRIRHAFPPKRYPPGGGSLSDDGRFMTLSRNDGFGVPHTIEVLDDRGTLLGFVKIGRGNTEMTGTVSWKSGTLVTYDRRSQKMAAYDLPVR